MRYLILMILFLLTACEDCSKPTKEVCTEHKCHTVFVYNAALKHLTPVRYCKCLKREEVKNECYFKDNK